MNCYMLMLYLCMFFPCWCRLSCGTCECRGQCRSTGGITMNTPTFPFMSVRTRDFCWQVGGARTFSIYSRRLGSVISTVLSTWDWKNKTLNLHLLLCSVRSRSGLLHKVMEPERRPLAEDYPITPPDCKRPDPQRRLLLQVGWLQGSPWPAHGRQT